MTQDEIDDRIFLAMLKQSREGKGPLFDLRQLCTEEGITVSSSQLLAFVEGALSVDGSSDASTHDALMFEISAEGLRGAKMTEQRLKPPTLVDRLADDKFQKIGNLSISLLSFLVSIGALIVAIFALSKATNAQTH